MITSPLKISFFHKIKNIKGFENHIIGLIMSVRLQIQISSLFILSYPILHILWFLYIFDHNSCISEVTNQFQHPLLNFCYR